MISNDNFVNLIGNLGNKPTIKTLPSGSLLVEFSLATQNNYTDRDGNKVKNTDWHRVKAFGKVAEILNQYLDRGSKVAILGSIRYSKWVDKFEQNRVNTDIIVESFRFLDGRPNGEQRQGSREESHYDENRRGKQTSNRRSGGRQPAHHDESKMPNAEEKLPF